MFKTLRTVLIAGIALSGSVTLAAANVQTGDTGLAHRSGTLIAGFGTSDAPAWTGARTLLPNRQQHVDDDTTACGSRPHRVPHGPDACAAARYAFN